MFQKLRIKLTLFNIAIIGGILLIIAVVIFWGSPYGFNSNRVTEEMGKVVLKDLREGSAGQLRYIKGAIFIIFFSLVLVFIGSLIISKLALKPIKKAYQKQLDFTADASHELRTPLAVIQTNLELVLGNSEETVESQSKWLNNILVENKRMKKLVEDLLTLSRADTNQNILETSKFYIDDTIISVVDLLMPYANEKNIALMVNLKPNVEFLGDKNRIKQLIIILVDNAIKYTESKGTVKVNLDYNDKKIWVSICDTGVGFSDEAKSKIFERFYRLDKARSRHSGGLGLGLSIAKWIALEHGGSIEVESHIGKGSNFIITLPLY